MNYISRILITSILFFSTLLTIAQGLEDINFVHQKQGSKVVSSINLLSGKINFSTSLKEEVMFAQEIPKKKCIYVSTRHYVYKIDKNTGEILIEFQHTKVLSKEESEATDPNIMITPPFQFSDNGKGLTYIMMEKARELKLKNDKLSNPTDQKNLDFTRAYSAAISKIDLYIIDIENQTKTLLIKSLNNLKYDDVSSITIIDNKLLLYKYDKTNFQFKLDFYSLEDGGLVEELNIPVNFNENNNFGFSKDKIERCFLTHFTRDSVLIHMTPPLTYEFDATSSLTTNFKLSDSYFYYYNLKTHKNSKLDTSPYYDFLTSSGYINSILCKENYVWDLSCPEEKPMPTSEVYVPKKHTRKTRAEAEEINAQRLKEYQKKLDEWSASFGNSECELSIYKDAKTDANYVHTLIGTTYATIYEDQYLFYTDGLDMVMYDFKRGKELWSLSL